MNDVALIGNIKVIMLLIPVGKITHPTVWNVAYLSWIYDDLKYE